jgi:uncharacterized protein YxjI
VRFVLQPSDADIFITDAVGRDAYWVQGPTERVGRWSLRDLGGGELAAIRQHGSPFLPWFGIDVPGRPRAELRERAPRGVPRAAAALWNALVGAPSRIRYTLETGGQPLRVEGDAAALEYAFLRGRRRVATASARWMAPSAAWGVAVDLDDAADALLVLAAAATIEISWGRMGREAPRRPRVPSRSRP